MKTTFTTQPSGLAWNTLTHTAAGIRTLDDCRLSHPTRAWNVRALYVGDHRAIAITTATGKHLIGSLNQTVFTIDKKTGQIIPTHLSKITKNDHLVGATINPLPSMPMEDDLTAEVVSAFHPIIAKAE